MANYYRDIISYHFKHSNIQTFKHFHLAEIPFAAICVDFIHVFDDELSQSLLRGCVQHLAGFHPAQTSPYYANPSPDFTLLSLGATKKRLTFSTMLCEVSLVLFGWRSLILASKFQAFYSFQTFIVYCKHNMVWFVRRAFETIEKRGAFETVGENAPRELFQFKPWAFLIKSSLLFVFARRRVCK